MGTWTVPIGSREHISDRRTKARHTRALPHCIISTRFYRANAAMPLDYFAHAQRMEALKACTSAVKPFLAQSWPTPKAIVDRIHCHICGHARYSDIRTLLQRNNLWSQDVETYLISVISKFRACRATSPPHQTRKISLSSLSRQFNETVCIEHMYPGSQRITHLMDARTRLSAGMIAYSASLTSATHALTLCWFTPY